MPGRKLYPFRLVHLGKIVRPQKPSALGIGAVVGVSGRRETQQHVVGPEMVLVLVLVFRSLFTRIENYEIGVGPQIEFHPLPYLVNAFLRAYGKVGKGAQLVEGILAREQRGGNGSSHHHFNNITSLHFAQV